MYKKRQVEVFASEIAEVLNLKLNGDDFIVREPGSIKDFKEGTVILLASLEKELVLSNKSKILAVVSPGQIQSEVRFSYIVSSKPRLAFVRILNEFFVEKNIRFIESSARIAPGAKIGMNVHIGNNSVVGPDVVIGDNTIVLNNVVITGQVIIGKNCVIKDNSTIGSEGYSFEFDEELRPIHVPYVGRIVIADNVWVGSNTSIERAEIDDTVIEAFVKIDDLVQIGQNCYVGERSMIASGAVVSASVRLGKDCWLAPNVSVRDLVTIGDNVMVGIGGVVVKDLAPGGVYVGNPAKFLRPRHMGENNG
jgi:UDP-3-O-[3-hydroxymyristoyl] glucosamine N-acyltransferase